jgi:ribosomal protein S20
MSKARKTIAPMATAPASPPLGAVKTVMRQFAEAHADSHKDLIGAELREAYRFLCQQAEQAGIDPQRALAKSRAAATQLQVVPSAKAAARGKRR